jgi:polysaccharide export outer membrane protein
MEHTRRLDCSLWARIEDARVAIKGNGAMRPQILLVIGALLTLAAAGCSSTGADLPALPQTAQADTTYRLGPGDHLKVTVFGAEDLSGDMNVSDNGTVSMPLIGDVKAGGLTTRELAQEMQQKLKDGYMKDPRVSIQAAAYRPVYIYGEVTKPGEYPYVAGMSVQNAVALGGGYSYRANETYVVVTRNNKNYRANPAAPVAAGDVIRVPERYF